MDSFKLILLPWTLACICIPGLAQSADESSDSLAPEQLLARQIENRTQLAQEIAAQHLLAHLRADELMAQHKFGLARHTLRRAQQALISRRDDIPQTIFTFLETLGCQKLLAIDSQELIFLRKRLAGERARRAELASKVPQTPAEGHFVQAPATLLPPKPSATAKATAPLKPIPTPRLAAGALRWVRRGLQRRISIVQYDDTTLADVLDDLRSKSSTNIVTNWQSLANLGIDKTTSVSLNLRNISAGRVLKIILQNLSSPYARISYIIQDDVVFIASAEDLDMILELGVYEIADLLMETKDKRGGPQFSPGGYDRDRSDRQRPDNSRRPR